MIELFKYGIIGALTTFLNIFIYFILRSILNLFLFFALTRYITGLLDIGIMVIGVEVFKQDDKLLKIISNVIGIILNYITSKFLIFKK